MPHDVEVDQSGRTDTLTVDTVLAFSDGIQFAILIPKAVKQACHRYLKAKGVRSHRVGVKLLIAGLVILLKDHIRNIERVTIDCEYLGGVAGDIKAGVFRLLRLQAPELHSEQIVFRQIGKGSSAHELALHTYRRKREPDRHINAKELLDILR